MRNKALVALNFQDLLHYRTVPDRGAQSAFRIPCNGFCVSCEKDGLLDAGRQRLDQMSHGADTEDFERSISEPLAAGRDAAVVFLLESPGGDYGNGEAITFDGVTKRPPVNHYYWTAQRSNWPRTASEIVNPYGDYFAYLIAKHRLGNAYFTNIVKCSLVDGTKMSFLPLNPTRNATNRDSKILSKCTTKFLLKELQLVDPKAVFYLGCRAEKMGYLTDLRTHFPKARFARLLHPASRRGRAERVRRNDEAIASVLGCP